MYVQFKRMPAQFGNVDHTILLIQLCNSTTTCTMTTMIMKKEQRIPSLVCNWKKMIQQYSLLCNKHEGYQFSSDWWDAI